MSKVLPLRPRLSEKTYELSESRVYVVEVPKSANKHTITSAMEAQFEVKVKAVNTTNVKGKTKRTMSLTGKRYSNSYGKRSDIKKAYVTLAEGHSLPFFAAVEEEEQKEEETQKKIDKAVAKKSEKDAKKPRLSGLRRNKKEEAEG